VTLNTSTFRLYLTHLRSSVSICTRNSKDTNWAQKFKKGWRGLSSHD